MISRIRKYLLFSLLFLPFGAFADITTPLSYLTPPQGDFSINLLNRVFGSVGNSLSGYGNQMVGTVIGVFNTFWVIMIGVAVMYVVWDSVITAAQNGEMMSGKGGKKTVHHIIRIVIAFGLVVPSASSGYSLGQQGVMWVVVQGVGLADQISSKLNTFVRSSGGMVVNNKPTQGKDLVPIMPQVANILKAQICMYKLEDLFARDRKIQSEVEKANTGEIPTSPNPVYDGDKIGYSINPDNTLTMGTRNDKYNADDVNNNHRYNGECGTLSWENGVAANYSRITFGWKDKMDQAGAAQQMTDDINTSNSYLEQGSTEMFNKLLPIAKAIAAVDLKAADSDSTLTDIANRGGTVMANSGISYATLLDPLRYKAATARSDSVSKRMDDLASKGWVFTPLSVILPGLSQVPFYNIADVYPPGATVVDSKSLKTEGYPFDSLSDDDRTEIANAMARVDLDQYVGKANTVLNADSSNTGGANIDFGAILSEFAGGNDDLSSVTKYINMGFAAPNYILDMAQGASGALMDGAGYLMDAGSGVTGWLNTAISASSAAGSVLKDGVVNTVGDYVKDDLARCLNAAAAHGDFSGDSCKPSSDKTPEYNPGGDTISDPFQDAKDKIMQAKDTVLGSIQGAQDSMNELKQGLINELGWSKKGGMNNALATLSEKAGPMGPIFTAIMTNMIGHGIDDLERNMFNSEYNAFNAAIILGGSMMSSALTAFFQFTQITFWTKMVEGVVGGVPLVGGVAKGILGGFHGMVGFYIAFATIFFMGGIMLYLLMPLTFIFGFAASTFRWIGMAFINIMAAPIFCFNLVREGEGLVGRGERYLSDLARTAVTPAILTLGAVAFIILFNIAFLLISTIYAQFLPIVLEIYNNPALMAVTLGVTLVVFSMIILWVSQILTSLCTAEFVQAVEHAIGEGIQRMGDNNPTEQIRQAVSGGGQQVTNTVKQVTGSPTGGGQH